jgi:hypothetical protein
VKEREVEWVEGRGWHAKLDVKMAFLL